MPKSNKEGSKKDKKTKIKTRDQAKVASKKEKPHLQDPELIPLLNIIDNQWKCTVLLIILPNQTLYETLLPQLDGQGEITVITEKDISEPTTKESKSRKGSRNRSKSLASAKSSKKSKKTTVKANKKSRSRSKNTKLSLNKELPCSKTCLSLKKYIIGLKETDVNKLNSEKIPHETNLLPIKAETDGQNNGEEINNDRVVLHRFIILWGFYDPKIPEELAKFMIPLRAIIHVREPIDPPTLPLDKTSIKKINKKKSVGSKKINPVSNKLNSDYSLFVDEMNVNINDRNYLEVNKDIIFVNFTTNSNINIDNFKTNMMNLFQTIKVAWEKYENYTKSNNVQHIPFSNEKLELGSAELYSTLVSLVPLECINIPIIIHCMLEQVAWWADEKLPSRTSFLVGENGSSEPDKTNTASILRQLITKNITPVIVEDQDEIKLNTFHLYLPEFNFQEISTKMYTRSPVHKLWEIYPAQTHSRSTWFEFQLQKLRYLNSNCYFNQNKHYLHHLHLLLMNALILNFNYISENRQYTDDETNLFEFSESDYFEFSSKKPQVVDKHANIFVGQLINNMLSKNLQRRTLLSKTYCKELTSGESTESEQRRLSDKPKWYETNITSEISQTETLLQKKAQNSKEKLNRLKSFLLCSDIVGLYEIISKLENEATFYDCLHNYDFIQELDYNIMGQTLQNAFHTFTNVNYEYFAPSDTLLLWFNNVCGNDLKSKENINVVLETPLGFREFYECKHKGKTNWIESAISSCDGNMSSEKCDGPRKPPCTVYDLGSSRLEVAETLVQFESPDSSKVLIKKCHYFDKKKCYLNVSFTKNNTKMSYEVDPDIDSKNANVKITFHNGILANCSFTWKSTGDKYSSEGVRSNEEDDSPLEQTELQNKSYVLDCILSISLPSGLFIEVVPTDSDLGPFYIKQQYLSKGPECNKVWGEAYRCYLKNGTIIIFHNDNTVAVLYSNGTKVTCSSIENIQEPIDISEEQLTKEVTKDDLSTLHKKVSIPKKAKGNTLKNTKAKTKKVSLVKDKIQKVISKQNEKELIINENVCTTNKEKAYKNIVKISEHSVLCANGECRTFQNGTEIKKESIHTLRMGFDSLNQELYLQRSDGLSSLFTEEALTTVYNDGSKITSYLEDNTELIDDYNLQYTPDLDSKQLTEQQIVNMGNFVIVDEQTENQQDDLDNSANFNESDEFENFVFVETNYLLEHNNYATVKFSNDEQITEISLPGLIKIQIDNKKLFVIVTDDGDKICLKEDNSLQFEASVLLHSLKPSRSVIHFVNFENHLRIISQTMDSFDNKFSIDDRGNADLVRCKTKCDRFDDVRGPPRYPQNFQRFFVFQRDCTGYEMIHNNQTMNKYSNTHTTDKDILKFPLLKGNDNLFTLYTQQSLYKNKSEEYLMRYIDENNLPSMMKRKHLLKREDMPETIWFHRTSSVSAADPSVSFPKAIEKPKAMLITQRTKIKTSDNDLVSTFSRSLRKYIKSSEEHYNKYKDHYVKDVRNENVHMEGKQLNQNLFGSKSYHLVDNLPVVAVGNNNTNVHQYPEVTIKDILSSCQITL